MLPRYADDTVLIAETEQDLQAIVDIVKTESEKFGLLMNVKKTKTMLFSKKKDNCKISIEIDGKIIEQVKSFQYLGALLTEDGKCETEIIRRIALAKGKFSKMNSLITSHDLSLTTKTRLTKCYIWSTLLYGCETWSLTKPLEKKLRAFEMWTYRRIARVSWKEKKTNHQVLQTLGITSTVIVSTVRKRIARYFGHIRRHDSLQKTIAEGKIEGKRGRGRRRTSWLGNIAAYVGSPINHCAKLANERENWRTMIPNVVSVRL